MTVCRRIEAAIDIAKVDRKRGFPKRGQFAIVIRMRAHDDRRRLIVVIPFARSKDIRRQYNAAGYRDFDIVLRNDFGPRFDQIALRSKNLPGSQCAFQHGPCGFDR